MIEPACQTEEEHQLRVERRASPEQRLRLAGIPERFWGLCWDDYIDHARTADGEGLRHILRHYGAEYWKEPTGEGILVIGDAGIGKTMGVALMAKMMIEDQRELVVRFTSMIDLVERSKRFITLERERERSDADYLTWDKEERRLGFLKYRCGLLVIDDVGKEYTGSKTGYAESILEQVLRHRYNARLATALTTNLELDEWAQYNEQMPSLLAGLGEIVVLARGRDLRNGATSFRSSRRHAER